MVPDVQKMDKYSSDNVNCKDDPSPESVEFDIIKNKDSIDIKTENPIDVTENSINITIKDINCLVENNNKQIPKYADFVIENSNKDLTDHLSNKGVIDSMEEVIKDYSPFEEAPSKIEIIEHSLELENIQVLEDIYRNYNEFEVEDRRGSCSISSESKLPDNIPEQKKSVKNTGNPKKKEVQKNTLDRFIPTIPGRIVKQKEPVKKTRKQKKKELQSNTLDSFVSRTRGTIDCKVKKKTNNKRVPLETFKRLFIRLEKINISDKLHTISEENTILKETGRTPKLNKQNRNEKLSSTETVDKNNVINKIQKETLLKLHKKKDTSLTQSPERFSKDSQGVEENKENVVIISKNKKAFVRIEPKVIRNVTFDKKNNKTYYQCFNCNKCFPKRKSLVHHIKRVHSKKEKKELSTKYECHHCGVIVKHRRSIVSHLTQWHSQGAELQCTKCPYVTKLKQALRTHFYRVHVSNDEKPMYKCHLCPYESPDKYTVQKHIEKVHEKKIKKKKCEQCYWEGDIARISCHIRAAHSNEKYFCDKCSFQTNLKGNLSIHQLKHNEHKDFKCPKCQYQTNYTSRLKKHIKNHEAHLYKRCPECSKMVRESSFYGHRRIYHKIRMKEKCPQCEKEVFSLTKHLQTHNRGYRKVKCPECIFMCTNKTYLTLHMKKCHQESKEEITGVICYYCNKELTNKTGLISHIRSVHMSNACECPTCGKHLKSKEYLAGHLRKMHDNSKWFECKICPNDNVYGTKHKTGFRNHMLQHNSKEVYNCELCPYETKVPEYLKMHVFKVHKKKS